MKNHKNILFTMETQDYKFIEDNFELVHKVVVNASCSFIPIEFRQKIIELGNKYGYLSCSTCNTGIYLATSKLYDMYLKDKAEKHKNIKEENETIKHSNTKKSRKK